ncbi:hypothetical protein PoB_003665900 [Plakobranchus ocellatus]|uniref:Uncharacterized protein n=1 Tax=Plakobranchus ocellatus TaxID=259542 RepID=A0AAV4AVM1_9GAST|nr:hypothetical protein PoB_003665900 [Plakobranchus ocellatus]
MIFLLIPVTVSPLNTSKRVIRKHDLGFCSKEEMAQQVDGITHARHIQVHWDEDRIGIDSRSTQKADWTVWVMSQPQSSGSNPSRTGRTSRQPRCRYCGCGPLNFSTAPKGHGGEKLRRG